MIRFILIIVVLILLVMNCGSIKRFTNASFSLFSQTEIYEKTAKRGFDAVETEALRLDSLQKHIDDSLHVERMKRLSTHN